MTDPVRPVAPRIDRVLQRVAELPDRTSPDDWPEAMLVTAGELRGILESELAAAPVPCAASPAPTLEVIVNGQPVVVPAGSVREIIEQAIRRSGQIGAPVAQWELRTTEGDIIPHDLTDGTDYELTPGRRLWLNLGPPLRATGEGARDEGEVGVQRVVDVLTAAPVAVSLDPHRLPEREEDRDKGAQYPRLKGRCPSCGHETLFRGYGGYVTCSWLKCADPSAAHDLLARLRGEATVRVEE